MTDLRFGLLNFIGCCAGAGVVVMAAVGLPAAQISHMMCWRGGV